MRQASVIVFDIDGTLMDHAEAARAALAGWVVSLGQSMTTEIAMAWEAAERRHFTAWREGEISFAEQRRRRLREVLPLLGQPVGDDDQLDRVFAHYLRRYEAAWLPYPDVRECLERLRVASRRLAVLSNGAAEQQRRKLKSIGVASFFSEVFTPDRLGVAKPHPEAFQRAAELLGVAPSECFYVGDDHEADVLAARRAGWRAVHLDRTGQMLDADAIAGLDQLLP
ncbi:HAD family hydrolase [Luteococcus peritonei]|uniref:HAD family hydrolase n=1 Tax=Luteococcus peritonei TaxID=88874 RepID=A0ABW4RT08_9ACTN